MNELAKIEGEVKAEVQKFEGWVKTLELKFFGGILHQKIVAPHEGTTPAHAWVPIDSHEGPAPAPGEPIPSAKPEVVENSTSTSGSATGSTT